MDAKTISKRGILKLVTHLKERYEVIAPQRRGKETLFAPVDKTDEVVLTYQTTLLPPKVFLLPPEEELFIAKGGRVSETPPPEPFVLFGLNLKDLEGICRLDEIMSQEPADSFYLRRRKEAVLIAISDKEVGIPPGGDLILEKVGANYQATPLTKAGEKITSLPSFKKGAPKSEPQPKNKPTKLEELLLDSELLCRAIEWSRENYPEIWEKLGKICLNCGICTYACPLCYCFEMEDKISLDRSACSRCRQWSACTLPGFATVAGGHNFRPTIKDRYFNWYYHKFVRAYKEFGRAQCVACGRCQKYCPAGIDIEKYLVDITDKFQKAHPERKF